MPEDGRGKMPLVPESRSRIGHLIAEKKPEVFYLGQFFPEAMAQRKRFAKGMIRCVFWFCILGSSNGRVTARFVLQLELILFYPHFCRG